MEMHDFAEKARRGGITMACRRYFRANNPKCKNFYMRSPKTWLSYVDANNLYGWAMSQYLPIGGNISEAGDILRKDGEKNYVSVEKLITHLGPRDEYVLHYSEL
ncbi:uncharacterized protein OCT59_003223 [Rhizophagus irregularis]|uniref:uncharacterized protein n=1 Tax=Rhizophagus irregularis TaxID=588596 RepID=UPI0033192FD1|nr:hypothetical protein OCT59_003223 [Rhizophagus irregularis]